MTHTDIVKKLIGNIHPIGDSRIDEGRLENLKAMCELVKNLVNEIEVVHFNNKDSHEHSVKKAYDYASDFLTNTLGIQE